MIKLANDIKIEVIFQKKNNAILIQRFKEANPRKPNAIKFFLDNMKFSSYWRIKEYIHKCINEIAFS